MLRTLLFSCAICFLQTTVGAEVTYTMHDIGTLATDNSSAIAINEMGMIAGKYHDKDSVADYVWDKETGLQVITTDSAKGAYPKINNKGQVAGVLVKKPTYWWESDSYSVYLYDAKNGLKDLKSALYWMPDDPISIINIDDLGRILICNHLDVFSANVFAMWDNGKFHYFRSEENLYISAMNNHSEHLVTMDHDFFFGLLFQIYFVQIYNQSTREHVNIVDGERYYGLGLNDNRQVIARDKYSTKGIFWSEETGIVDLNHFIPKALNNKGDLVGKVLSKESPKVGSVLVRKVDGTLVDLNEAVKSNITIADYEKIVDATDINDKGQIVVTARISGKEHVLLLNPI